jgi:hypothetical protein
MQPFSPPQPGPVAAFLTNGGITAPPQNVGTGDLVVPAMASVDGRTAIFGGLTGPDFILGRIDNGDLFVAANLRQSPALAITAVGVAGGLGYYIAWQAAAPGSPQIWIQHIDPCGNTISQETMVAQGDVSEPALASLGGGVFLVWRDGLSIRTAMVGNDGGGMVIADSWVGTQVVAAPASGLDVTCNTTLMNCMIAYASTLDIIALALVDETSISSTNTVGVQTGTIEAVRLLQTDLYYTVAWSTANPAAASGVLLPIENHTIALGSTVGLGASDEFDIAYDPTTSSYLFVETRPAAAGIQALVLDTNLMGIPGQMFLVDPATTRRPRVVTSTGSSGWTVAY